MVEQQPAPEYQTGEVQMQSVYTETGQPSNSQVYYTDSEQPASNQTIYNNRQGDNQDRIHVVEEQPYQDQPVQLPGEVYTQPERQ